MSLPSLNAIKGTLLGLMLGDSLGLPYEGMSSKRIKKLFNKNLRHRLLFRYGMVSDDTEHAVMTAMAAAQYPTDIASFQRNLAWRLRWWFCRLPPGIGLATGRAIIKLWLGFAPQHSGVFSAGNGPAMRAPILGVLFGHDTEKLKAYVKASTQLTHTDPKAYVGALACAVAAFMASQQNSVYAVQFKKKFLQLVEDENQEIVNEFTEILDHIIELENKADGINDLQARLGIKHSVSGYMYHTVPVVLMLWLNYRKNIGKAISHAIQLGGDTDTIAAILGGIIGSGLEDIDNQEEPLSKIIDWPLNRKNIIHISEKIYTEFEYKQTVSFGFNNGLFIFFRNMVLLIIVLVHGFRRLLPPY